MGERRVVDALAHYSAALPFQIQAGEEGEQWRQRLLCYQVRKGQHWIWQGAIQGGCLVHHLRQ